MKLRLTLSVVFALGFASPTLAFNDMERQLIKLFRQAIVKVEVSGKHPQLDGSGLDTCKSEGMGFLVSRTHVISAKHVIDVDPDCGRRIAVSSAATSFQSMTEVVSTYGDIVLLKLSDTSAPPPMCSLAVADRNVYDQSVVRFAMPASLVDPEPLMTEVGEPGQFAPNIRFSPAPVHAGDSGGPIIHMFSVVGITKEKLTQVDGYGIMIPVDPIAKLLRDANFLGDNSTCNPLLMNATLFQATFSSDILNQTELRAGLETAIAGVSHSFGETTGLGAPAAQTVILAPGGGSIQLPPLAGEPLAAGGAGNAGGYGIDPGFARIVAFPDGKGVSVIFGQQYPDTARGILEDSLKSQIWSTFTQSLKSRSWDAQP